MGRTYRRGRMPLKEVKRIVLEHCGSESYVNELNEDELRNLADEIEYSDLILLFKDYEVSQRDVHAHIGKRSGFNVL